MNDNKPVVFYIYDVTIYLYIFHESDYTYSRFVHPCVYNHKYKVS